MDLFSELKPFSHKVGIIVPSTVNVDEEVDSQSVVDKTIEVLSKVFGGATAVEQKGGWVTEDGKLVIENSTMVYSYTEELSTSYLNLVYYQAEWIARELNQEAVAVEIDNKMYFVEQNIRERKNLKTG